MAVVGRGEAAQLEPQVEEHTAIALENKVRAGGGETQTRPAELELHAHPRADTRDHQPPNHPARTDCGSAPALLEHRAARPRQCLGRRQPAAKSRWPASGWGNGRRSASTASPNGPSPAGSRAWPAAPARSFPCSRPDNATGNFVRIVQRLPVRVRFAGAGELPEPDPPRHVGADCDRYHCDFVRQSTQHW